MAETSKKSPEPDRLELELGDDWDSKVRGRVRGAVDELQLGSVFDAKPVDNDVLLSAAADTHTPDDMKEPVVDSRGCKKKKAPVVKGKKKSLDVASGVCECGTYVSPMASSVPSPKTEWVCVECGGLRLDAVKDHYAKRGANVYDARRHWFLVYSGVTVEIFCGWSTAEFCRNFLLKLPIRPLSLLEASAKNVMDFQVPAAAFLRATHCDDFEQLGLDKWHIRFKVWIELERMLEVRYAEHTDVASHEFASLSWRHWQAIGQFPWQKHKGVRDYRGEYEAKEQEKLRVAAKRYERTLAKKEAFYAKRKAERREKKMEQRRREETEAAARRKLEEAKAEAKRKEDADARAKAEAKAKTQMADATLRAGFAAPPLSEDSRREADIDDDINAEDESKSESESDSSMESGLSESVVIDSINPTLMRMLTAMPKHEKRNLIYVLQKTMREEEEGEDLPQRFGTAHSMFGPAHYPLSESDHSDDSEYGGHSAAASSVSLSLSSETRTHRNHVRAHTMDSLESMDSEDSLTTAPVLPPAPE